MKNSKADRQKPGIRSHLVRNKSKSKAAPTHPPSPLLTLQSPRSFQVRVYDLSRYEHGADDVLILATDGLWDVLSNEEVAEAVTQFLPNCDPDDPHRWARCKHCVVSQSLLRERLRNQMQGGCASHRGTPVTENPP